MISAPAGRSRPSSGRTCPRSPGRARARPSARGPRRAHDGAADNSPSRGAVATASRSFVGSVSPAKLRRTDLGAVATAGWSASCRPNSGGGIRQLLSPAAPQERCRPTAVMLGAHRRPVGFAGWGGFVVDAATPAVGGPLPGLYQCRPHWGAHRPQGAVRRPQRPSPVTCAAQQGLWHPRSRSATLWAVSNS